MTSCRRSVLTACARLYRGESKLADLAKAESQMAGAEKLDHSFPAF
jgi:hypothetical protein